MAKRVGGGEDGVSDCVGVGDVVCCMGVGEHMRWKAFWVMVLVIFGMTVVGIWLKEVGFSRGREMVYDDPTPPTGAWGDGIER